MLQCTMQTPYTTNHLSTPKKKIEKAWICHDSPFKIFTMLDLTLIPEKLTTATNI